MRNPALSILLAFIGFSFLNLGQAIWKLGASFIKPKDGRPPRKLKGILIWLGGMVFTSSSVLIILAAVSMGSVATVGAMAGSGLVTMTIFSHFILKEKIGKWEIIGILMIVIAAVLIGAFNKEMKESDIKVGVLFLFMGIVIVAYIIGWVVVGIRKVGVGILIGGFSGALRGMVPMIQKISTSEIGRLSSLAVNRPQMVEQMSSDFWIRMLEIFGNPYFVLWMLINNASMVILQFAHRRGKAIRFIPAFNANYVLMPVIGGVLCFGEQLNILQWIGVGLILTGVYFISILSHNQKVLEKEKKLIDGEVE